MPKVDNHYIGAETLLPRGNDMARAHVVLHSHNASWNVMGRAHINPILDTRICQVEIDGFEATEFTTNITAKSMYTQCNADQNENLFLDALVDYHKNNKAISLSEKQTSVWHRLVIHKTTAGWQICCQWKDGSTS